MLCVSASAQAGGSRNDADYGGGYLLLLGM
jgi:hypothetical protein